MPKLQFGLRWLLLFILVAAYLASQYKTQEYRDTMEWAVAAAARTEAAGDSYYTWTKIQKKESLADANLTRILRHAIRRESDPALKSAALKLLVEECPQDVHDVLRKDHRCLRTDVDLLAAAIRLRGLHREPADIGFFSSQLAHRSPSVRAAAADAIGLLHQPAHPIPLIGFHDNYQILLRGAVPIDLRPLLKELKAQGSFPSADEVNAAAFFLPQEVRPEIRERLVNLLAKGETPIEREAAARALLAWPRPDQVHATSVEFFVWYGDRGSCLLPTITRRPVDSYYRTNVNDRDVLLAKLFPRKRCGLGCIIFLREVHQEVFDIEFLIRCGEVTHTKPSINDLVPEFVPYRFRRRGSFSVVRERLNSYSEGYPWIAGNHRRFPSMYKRSANRKYDEQSLYSLGGRWQNIHASKNKKLWMQLDERTTVRESGSFVADPRGEASTYLSFCGVSDEEVPLRVAVIQENCLSLCETESELRFGFGFALPKRFEHPVCHVEPADRVCFLVNNNEGEFDVRRGVLSGLCESTTLTELPVKRVRGEFVGELMKRGMLDTEAVKTWELWCESLFFSNAHHVVTFLKHEEKEIMATSIRPAPVKRIRIGVAVMPVEE